MAVLVAALSGVPRAVDVLLSCGYCGGAGCQICRCAALLRAACEIWARNDQYSQSQNCIFVTSLPSPWFKGLAFENALSSSTRFL